MENIEYETKVLKFDLKSIINKLKQFGAKEVPEVLMRRYVFDLKSANFEWIRLRDHGNKVTTTYKHKIIKNTELGKTTEIEVEVSDFEKAAQIFKKLPFFRIFYQENKRHLFQLDKIEFSIDTWPMIDPYLEIESDSKENVERALTLLGLTGKDVGDKDIEEIYQSQGIDLHSYSELKF